MRGHWKLLYYFSLKLSARLGGEVKSLTGGHYAAKRISLRQTSTVMCDLEIHQERVSYISVFEGIY